jgi:PhnB protein
MPNEPIPAIYDSLIPSLVVDGAEKAIAFYKHVFGAEELMRMNMPGSSKIAHAELKIRGHVLMLGDGCPEMGITGPKDLNSIPPFAVMLYVEDTDDIHRKAVDAGAKSIMAPEDMFWGDRYAKFIDPFGHQWAVATHLRDVPQEECDRAVAEWAKKQNT